MASAFIQYALARGEGFVTKSMLCTLAKKLKNCRPPLTVVNVVSILINPLFHHRTTQPWKSYLIGTLT